VTLKLPFLSRFFTSTGFQNDVNDVAHGCSQNSANYFLLIEKALMRENVRAEIVYRLSF
jgi:hypothetical protein